MEQEFPAYFIKIRIKKNFQLAGSVDRYLLRQIIIWAEIIASILDKFKPPLSIRLINAVLFTLSFPFQTKEYIYVIHWLGGPYREKLCPKS